MVYYDHKDKQAGGLKLNLDCLDESVRLQEKNTNI